MLTGRSRPRQSAVPGHGAGRSLPRGRCHLPTLGLHASAGESVGQNRATSPAPPHFHPEAVRETRWGISPALAWIRGEQDAVEEQVEAGAANICCFSSLRRVIWLSAGPLLQGGERGADRRMVLLSLAAKVSTARRLDARASASHACRAASAASGSAFRLVPLPRTSAVNRRASRPRTRPRGPARPVSPRLHRTTAAAGAWTSSHASRAGEGKAGGRPSLAGICLVAGGLCRHL